jgi:hypothetical protein
MSLFWIGIIITAISGAISNELVSRNFSRILPGSKKKYIPWLLLVFLVLGISISVFDKFQSETEQKKLVIYQEYSKYSANGHVSVALNGIRLTRTPLDDWNKSFSHDENDSIIFDEKLIRTCDSVIRIYPYFPFPYYYASVGLKKNNEDKWKKYAKKAEQILAMTTNFQGCHKDHVIYLNYVRKLQGNE